MKWFMLALVLVAQGTLIKNENDTPPPPSLQDLYLALADAGAANGSSCANAHVYTWFNTSGNWAGSFTVGKVSPDTAVHLCGTFTGGNATTFLTAQGSGTSGHPITVVFESGAVMRPNYCNANGCIDLNGKSYLVISGGSTPCGAVTKWTTTACNGQIENYAIGSTSLTCPNGSTCSALSGSIKTVGVGSNTGDPSHIEVKNIKLGPFYTRNTSDHTDGGQSAYGIGLFGGTLAQDITLDYSVCVSVAKCFLVSLGSASSTVSGYVMHHVNSSDQCWAMGVGANSTTLNVAGLLFHDNEVSNWAAFAAGNSTGGEDCHANGTMWFNGDGGTIHTTTGFIGDSASGSYNNYLHGDLDGGYSGASASGFLSCQDNCISVYFVNNVIVDTCTLSACGGPFYFNGAGGGGQRVINNTVVAAGIPNCVLVTGTTGPTVIKNNICSTAANFIGILQSTLTGWTTSDYNDVYNLTNPSNWVCQNTATCNSLATEQGAGRDVHSFTTNPNLTANYHLNAGSPAIGTGVNLTSLGITALNSDVDGVARPASAPWDIGASQYSTLFCSGTCFYVRSLSACANNGNGTSASCAASPGGAGAWRGFANVSWGSVTGDTTLNLVGGDTYTTGLVTGSSGTSGHPVNISVVTGTSNTATIDLGNTVGSIGFRFNDNYVTLDGHIGWAATGTTTYGIRVINIASDSGTSSYCGYADSVHHDIMLHVECSGHTQDSHDDVGGGFYFHTVAAEASNGFELGYGWVHSDISPVVITNITESGTTATVTTATAHGFPGAGTYYVGVKDPSLGGPCSPAGSINTCPGYEGTRWIATTTSPTTFTYSIGRTIDGAHDTIPSGLGTSTGGLAVYHWDANGAYVTTHSTSTTFNVGKIHDTLVENIFHDGLKGGANLSIYNNVIKHVEGSGHSDSLLIQSGGYSQIYNNYVEKSADQNIYLDNLYDAPCAHLRVYNNILNSNLGFGIIIDPEGAAGSPPASASGCSGSSPSAWDDLVIANNTFVSASSSHIRKGRSNPITNLVILNNIFGGGQVGGDTLTELFNGSAASFLNSTAWDYDLNNAASGDAISNWSGSNQTLAQLQALSPAREAHGTLGTAVFVNAGAHDYHLDASDTAAKGTGVDVTATYPYLAADKDGLTRASPPNRGAY